MIIARFILVISLVFNLVVVAININYVSTEHIDFMNTQLTDLVRGISTVLTILVVSCWPWIISYIKSSDAKNNFQAILFSVIAVVSCAVLFLPKYNGPDEGLGYQIIFLILICWLAYPVSLLARQK